VPRDQAPPLHWVRDLKLLDCDLIAVSASGASARPRRFWSLNSLLLLCFLNRQ
jgi:hypothetical protein